MIRVGQVHELREGDVIEARHRGWPGGQVIRGPVGYFGSKLCVAGYILTDLSDSWDLTVVSRALLPLYVNHPRTEPVAGDVVRDAASDPDTDSRVWLCDPAGDWWTAHEDTVRMAGSPSFDIELPEELWLLVDGETGQVVPS